MRTFRRSARVLQGIVALTGLALGAPSGHAQVAMASSKPIAIDWSLGADALPKIASLATEYAEAAGQPSNVPSSAAQANRDQQLPDNPQLTAPFVLDLGAMYVTNATTQASKTTNAGVGGVVDFESALGLKQETWVPFASARWRFADDFRLEAEYFSINRTSSHPAGQNIDWGGSIIPAGSQVDSKFDFTDVRLSAGWSFYKTQDKELGVALGLHVEDIRLNVSTTNTSRGEENVVAPLPVVSLFGGFAMSDHWSVAARFDAFKMTWDPYKGHLYDLGLDIVWNPWRNVGIGAGYRSLQLSGSVDSSHYKGELNAAYSGPIVYLNVAF